MALMEVSHLAKTYGGTVAVKGISFEIGAGRCLALLGPNGAGKTTTLNMLTGLLHPTSGSIRLSGIDDKEDRRRHIGYLPQYAAYYGWMSGKEFLVYAARLSGVEARSANERADDLLERVGLAEAKKRRIAGYSGGMKQRLGLAQAMIHQPKLLILDEPVSALDPIGRREVLEILRELKGETTLLFSTHVLHDAEELCDDLLIVRQGEIVIQGSLEQVKAQYQEPLIVVEPEAGVPLEQLAQRWGKLPGVERAALRGASIGLTVTDVNAARQALMMDALDSGIALRRFELAQTTLEDLFLKAVNQ